MRLICRVVSIFQTGYTYLRAAWPGDSATSPVWAVSRGAAADGRRCRGLGAYALANSLGAITIMVIIFPRRLAMVVTVLGSVILVAHANELSKLQDSAGGRCVDER